MIPPSAETELWGFGPMVGDILVFLIGFYASAWGYRVIFRGVLRRGAGFHH